MFGAERRPWPPIAVDPCECLHSYVAVANKRLSQCLYAMINMFKLSCHRVLIVVRIAIRLLPQYIQAVKLVINVKSTKESALCIV